MTLTRAAPTAEAAVLLVPANGHPEHLSPRVNNSADASGDREARPERPNADRSRPTGSSMPTHLAMLIWT